MSGGVDSSVAAFLMKRRGYDCIGATMKLFDNENIGVEKERPCCSLEDVEDARSVAYKLGIPYYVFNFSDRFKQDVIDRFINAYENGMTPNPCIDCNRFLKFDKLFLRAKELDCKYVVTGHYVRTEFNEESGRWLLKKAADASKDQSYVLYSLTQEQLMHVQFPLGGLSKSEVRGIAESEGFVNAKKRDSQDICFAPDGDYAGFIERTTGKKYPPGDILSDDGKVLGRHNGVIRYTIGQRRGLGLSFDKPMYVSNVDTINNTVTLSPSEGLYTKNLIAKDINIISADRLDGKISVTAKVRYRQKEQPATAVQLDEDTLSVEFDEPQRAVTKGQSVVLYDGDMVVGGGTIVKTW